MDDEQGDHDDAKGEHKEQDSATSVDVEVPDTAFLVSDETSEIVVSNPRSPRSWRFGLVSVGIFAGWAILIARLIQLQSAQQQLMNDRVTRQSIFSEVIPARRDP